MAEIDETLKAINNRNYYDALASLYVASNSLVGTKNYKYVNLIVTYVSTFLWNIKKSINPQNEFYSGIARETISYMKLLQTYNLPTNNEKLWTSLLEYVRAFSFLIFGLIDEQCDSKNSCIIYGEYLTLASTLFLVFEINFNTLIEEAKARESLSYLIILEISNFEYEVYLCIKNYGKHDNNCNLCELYKNLYQLDKILFEADYQQQLTSEIFKNKATSIMNNVLCQLSEQNFCGNTCNIEVPNLILN